MIIIDTKMYILEKNVDSLIHVFLRFGCRRQLSIYKVTCLIHNDAIFYI